MVIITLQKLIETGNKLKSEAVSQNDAKFLIWKSDVEQYIVQNYGENSTEMQKIRSVSLNEWYYVANKNAGSPIHQYLIILNSLSSNTTEKGLYTERHGMRKSIEKTYKITIKAYSLLFDCCERYFDNLAWKYPKECPDGNGCCGIDLIKFNEDMEFVIPTLFRRDGMIDKPRRLHNVFEADNIIEDEFDQYALFDLIEYISGNIRDISRKVPHSFYHHDDISYSSTNFTANRFLCDINDIFEKTGLLYKLNENFEIERVEEISIISEEIEENVTLIKEPGLKDLMQTAIKKHKSPYPEDQKDAVEKIWDALERLKTYYTTMDKKGSVSKIINDIAGGNPNYINLFDTEFNALKDIGNNYRIRHHETNKVDINDLRHYDYFFNRCLSLIALAINYLE